VPAPTFVGGSEFGFNPATGQATFTIFDHQRRQYRIVYNADLLNTNGWTAVIPPSPDGWTNGVNGADHPAGYEHGRRHAAVLPHRGQVCIRAIKLKVLPPGGLEILREEDWEGFPGKGKSSPWGDMAPCRVAL